ncbi:MAG: hypothetical protein ACOC2C_01035 [Cyclonatronaceae bacterium]
MTDCHCFHATASAADAQLPEGLPASKLSSEQLQPKLQLLSDFSLNSLSGASFLKQHQADPPAAGQKLSSQDLRAKAYGSAPEPLRIIYCSYLI